MSESLKRLDYIDALRGFAILGVILVHTSELIRNLPNELIDFCNKVH